MAAKGMRMRVGDIDGSFVSALGRAHSAWLSQIRFARTRSAL